MSDSLLAPTDAVLQQVTRRHFFRQCQVGVGSAALGSLLLQEGRLQAAGGSAERQRNPYAVQSGHFTPKAKRVIFLFMAGGPSQLELFDPKPKLQEMDGQVIPESYVKNKRFAFIKRDAKLLGSRRKFARHGESGAELSELLPHLATVADRLCIVRRW